MRFLVFCDTTLCEIMTLIIFEQDDGYLAEQQERRQSAKQKRQPLPPKHYIATLETLKSSEYPLPIATPDGKLVCPDGFVSTRPSTVHISIARLCFMTTIELCYYHHSLEY